MIRRPPSSTLSSSSAASDVYKRQVISRAGTYYTNYDEFANQLDDMVCDGGLREEMGKLGVQYVDRYYRWDKIIDSFSQMVEKVSDKAERKE